MSEEERLPCPFCGCDDAVLMYPSGVLHMVFCPECRMRGPRATNGSLAIHDWNSLPRVLRWTKEPPKELGRYWWRKAPRERLYIVELFPAEQHINMPLVCVRYVGIDDKVHYMATLDGEWAGPIPEPREAANAR